jgi:uncharacterized damage-inducible protein DinB
MTARVAWIDRRFSFDFPSDVYPELMERLRGTPARLDERVRPLPRNILTVRDGVKWSIQEHAGHVMDLEELWAGRIDDFMSDTETLRAADLTNQKTHEANHNSRDVEAILAGFRVQRLALIKRLEGLTPEDFGRTARHPRLAQPMRLCDSMYFAAEHDDYHLARITELVQQIG